MTNFYHKDEIQEEWKKGLLKVSDFVKNIDEDLFRKSENGKWSIEGNFDHLILSTKPIVKALGAPKFGLKMFGKPKNPSRSYSEVVEAYHEKLKTSNPVNNPFSSGEDNSMDKEELVDFWNSVCNRLAERLEKWKDSDLDKYVVPHPLLGKMTIREILFFTIYHTNHHLQIMQKIG